MNAKNTILIGLALLVGYLFIGALTLKSGSLNVDKNTGLTWNAITTGGQKVGTIEAQVLGAYNQQDDVVAQIVAGRRALADAIARGDISAATQIAGQLSILVQSLAEANPVTDLTPLQVAMIDETAEAFNVIGYQREQLIESQTSYSFSRAIFFPLAPFFPDVQILGADQNPAMPFPTSIFAPTPAQ